MASGYSALNKLIEISGIGRLGMRTFRNRDRVSGVLRLQFRGRNSSFTERRTVGYSACGGIRLNRNGRIFSYNRRTMESAMGPFSPFWLHEESITYVLSMV